jgi:hypothetical protein
MKRTSGDRWVCAPYPGWRAKARHSFLLAAALPADRHRVTGAATHFTPHCGAVEFNAGRALEIPAQRLYY